MNWAEPDKTNRLISSGNRDHSVPLWISAKLRCSVESILQASKLLSMHGNLCATGNSQLILWDSGMTGHKAWIAILLIIIILHITSLIWWKWAEWVRLIERAYTPRYNPCTKLSGNFIPHLFHSIHCSEY